MPDDGETREDNAVTDGARASKTEQTTDQSGDPVPQEPGENTGADQEPMEQGPPGPEQTVGLLAQEISDLKDQLLRKSADFDNYRKRMHREREEFAAYATRDLLLDIVPIIDDFERAIKSGEESEDFSAFHDGIVMIEKQFTSMLERKWKLVRFDSAGEEFDPQRHEAMMTEPVPGHDHSVVLEDFQKGYTLHERVLRPAKVKVSMPAPPTQTDLEDGPSSGAADVAGTGSSAETSSNE